VPKANLPSTPIGWLVALLASFVGFVAGFVVIAIVTRWMP
jgi:hypothetical protein